MSAFNINCPSCGGQIQFSSKSSIFAVCFFCRTNVLRHDMDLDNLGKQADLLPDMSPFQIGTTGKYKKNSFSVLGRIIVKWSDGLWNEWYLSFSDGSTGWLAEAQGDLAINFHLGPGDNLASNSELLSAKRVEVNGTFYRLTDSKEMVCIGSEGELPFSGVVGRESIVYDFGNSEGGFASLEVNKEDGRAFYVGEYIELRDLHAIGLRKFEGWS
jgi:hypothetical protein